ncbi:MAG TPA: hypothetical protein VKB23_11340 [Solirubrobacterales bacterium]|nr:hypothetical protein [Solirubrobacterales bacterium]
MAAIDRFILLVRSLRKGERGMALPTVLFAMVASMGLAGAAVVSSVDVQQGAKRDSGSKSAIAAADAGANIATMRLARYSKTLVSSECIGESGGALVTTKALTTGGQSWCPAVSGTVGRGTYTYWVSPAGSTCGGYGLCVVSVGSVDGVSRRIELTFNESGLEGGGGGTNEEEEEGGTSKLGFEGLIGQDKFEVTGNADIRVGIGTNGEVVGKNSAANVCGDIRVGIGKPKPNVKQCSGYGITYGNVNLPPVSSFMPTNIATSNADYRFTTCSKKGLPVGCQTDGFSANWNKEPFIPPPAKTLSLGAQEALTVGGPDYWLCKLTLNGGSELIMRAGSKVRFFFDTPQQCGMSAGATQFEMLGSSRITSTGYQSTPGNFDMPGFYFLGSGRVYIGGNNGTNEMVVYGPESEIELKGNATYKGLIAGKTLLVTGSATVKADAGYQLPPELQPPPKTGEDENEEVVRTSRLYTPQTYVECTGVPAAGEAPNVSC